jgi:hypothetical protein
MTHKSCLWSNRDLEPEDSSVVRHTVGVLPLEVLGSVARP